MSTAEKLVFHSVEAYLKAEELSLTRSEYINGLIRAMTGATNRHNTVSVNVQGILWSQLKGHHCRPSTPTPRFEYERARGLAFTTQMHLSFAKVIAQRRPFRTSRWS